MDLCRYIHSTQFYWHLLCVGYSTESLVGIQGGLEHVGNAFTPFLPCFPSNSPVQLPSDYLLWSLSLVSICSDVFTNVLCFFLTWAHSVTSEVILSSEAAVRVNNTLKHLEQLFGIKCSIDFSYYCCLSIP